MEILHDLIGTAGIEVEADEDLEDSIELLIAFFTLSYNVLSLDGIEVHSVEGHEGVVCEGSTSLIDRVLKSSVVSADFNLTVVNLSEDNNVFNIVSAELLKLCSIARIKVPCFIFVEGSVRKKRCLMGQRLLSFRKDSVACDHGVIDISSKWDFVEGGEKAEIEEGVVYDDSSFL